MKRAILSAIGCLLGLLALALLVGRTQAQASMSLQREIGAKAAADSRIPIHGRLTDASGTTSNNIINNAALSIPTTGSEDAVLGVSAAPPVYSQGQVTISGTWGCDLDLGKQTPEGAADFYWVQETEVARYVEPTNDARFHVIGIVDFASIGYSELKGYSYSTVRINGSNDASNQIPQQTVVAAVTNEGRYSKFRIDTYGYNLTITWLTYYKEYGVHLPLLLRHFP